jgi:cell division protein FtsX
MSILGIAIIVLLIVFGCWLVSTYIQPPFKTPILVVIVVLTLVWILSMIVPGLTTARVR